MKFSEVGVMSTEISPSSSMTLSFSVFRIAKSMPGDGFPIDPARTGKPSKLPHTRIVSVYRSALTVGEKGPVRNHRRYRDWLDVSIDE